MAFLQTGRSQTEIAGTLNRSKSTETLTLDNGSEFAAHAKINKRHSIDIFFAKPCASWQRGANENTNDRLRRLWPKKFDMATLSQEEIDNGVLLLNLTPSFPLYLSNHDNGKKPILIKVQKHYFMLERDGNEKICFLYSVRIILYICRG
ncbi:IS30 family transposase [Desulforhopalus vacuolatus]|nr:IS30 family transposase [Desulforhopalus vacuolatus]